MTPQKNSVERHDMHVTLQDNETYWPNSSEHSLLNCSQDDRSLNPCLHLDNVFDDLDSGNDSYYFNVVFYLLHDYEKKDYIYFWTFLVIITTVANMLIVAVFVRKSMRTPTNIILLFIAISDSLTGLVTLPTYIHVFTRGIDGVVSLKESWCEAFMISKFYISKAFHTVSIWQTLLLGFQRLCCVWFPYKTKSWFAIRRILIAVAVITIYALVIHSYHLHKKKADKMDGWCQWQIEDPCVESCSFLWITLLLVNILPSGLLLVLTILIIQRLFHHNIQNSSFRAEHSREWSKQNKRASIIVVCIAIIFLIPEIPYGIFLLVTVIKTHSGNNVLTLRTNRFFHFAYEIAMLLGFHANFWVYTIMDKRFRDEVKSMFLYIMRNFLSERTTVPLTAVQISMNQGESHSKQRKDVNEQTAFV
ncbi:hypothetical protein ACJMK2_029642 [Sinanodonta woodiana]|uniref:G-protein coupled receptors family 1 profile domain-containing protein n=1 Tax=Sinanodonta woodiana TaxID=1069815 RepID=A0ABD3XD55_SINWO